jgi:hypothetical protein
MGMLSIPTGFLRQGTCSAELLDGLESRRDGTRSGSHMGLRLAPCVQALTCVSHAVSQRFRRSTRDYFLQPITVR